MSKGHCIAIILGCVVVYFLLVAFCLGESLHYGIADDPTVKGKGKDGECIDYALALSSRLAAEGIHGHLIFYRWQICDTAIGGSHVFVVYHLPDDSVRRVRQCTAVQGEAFLPRFGDGSHPLLSAESVTRSSVCRAIMRSSSVGNTQAVTFEAGVERHGPWRSLPAASSSRPNHVA